MTLHKFDGKNILIAPAARWISCSESRWQCRRWCPRPRAQGKLCRVLSTSLPGNGNKNSLRPNWRSRPQQTGGSTSQRLNLLKLRRMQFKDPKMQRFFCRQLYTKHKPSASELISILQSLASPNSLASTDVPSWNGAAQDATTTASRPKGMTNQSARAARHRRRITEGFFESTTSSSSPVSRLIWYKEPKLLAVRPCLWDPTWFLLKRFSFLVKIWTSWTHILKHSIIYRSMENDRIQTTDLLWS